ncbi:hypothetical protein ASE75_03185 [Sphingomonas sp. Leaf17]|uniref:FMN-binding negative transcriptional regulator n=1 Tax=Sphingomonas sp. Leaf17 TaxID=1735683 RepID=UPI0006F7B026|nr:FMN-binding negative transcriptional regulator [Sphingomonas sp. Leaf17]KQM67895.1 hypothetical protein ASE75_03185 [Sphingomonas sp. Leaf17]
MHPNRAFHASDEAALLAAIDRIGFAHIVAPTPDGPMVVHAPISVIGGRPQFHVARANRIAAHLDGATVIASLVDGHGYISPNWYAAPGNQVPTWNYKAIELVGTVRSIDEAALIDQLDALAAAHEPRVNPANPWTRGKMDDGVFQSMLRAIRGFEIVVETVRGTSKLSQNTSTVDRAGVIAGLRAAGHADLADAMTAE